jgi:low affinity Fe/Cu permease
MLEKLATRVANFLTKPVVFATFTVLGIIWFASGILMGWSDLWNKIMDIPTTLLSFLFFFVVISAQNSDNVAIQAKLDELIDAIPGARNELERIEERETQEIEDKRL